MKITKIDLKEINVKAKGILTCYIRKEITVTEKEWLRPACIIAPGGSYRFTAEIEAEPIAMKFLSEGYNVFILDYSMEKYPQHIIDMGVAVHYVKSNAKELGINQNQVCAVGFSAGGHMTGNFTCEYNKVETILNYPKDSLKLNACCLSYPVITSGEFAHRESFENLTKGDKQLEQSLSLENLVTAKNPPTYIWHTRCDDLVPAQNSLLYAMALQNAGVEYELHIFPTGIHGLSNCEGDTAHINRLGKCYVDKIAYSWIEECQNFFARVIGYDKFVERMN